MSGHDTAGVLAEWFARWRTPLHRYVVDHYSMPGADSHDVVQEAFLRVLRYDRTAQVESPKAYLFQVAANVANEWAVRSRNRAPHRSQWLEDLVSDDSPEYDATRAETHGEIARALGTLTTRQRAILALHFGEGTGRARIATQLALSERTVKRELLRVYAKLRVRLTTDLLSGLVRTTQKTENKP
ncbi:MAG TPA: sigma-70 family RNA polymerase sigma factor [Steroidobacteraceae bacterium]|nr:sigma-70 family RNA polymerase sigma factor [Steroidobacteraceae bacterium]